jgi:hypothetical protein
MASYVKKVKCYNRIENMFIPLYHLREKSIMLYLRTLQKYGVTVLLACWLLGSGMLSGFVTLYAGHQEISDLVISNSFSDSRGYPLDRPSGEEANEEKVMEDDEPTDSDESDGHDGCITSDSYDRTFSSDSQKITSTAQCAFHCPLHIRLRSILV